jgi:hypothetical protein
MSAMNDTTLRSAEQLGMRVRLKWKGKGLSQTALALQQRFGLAVR